jgi:hypothetical protein
MTRIIAGQTFFPSWSWTGWKIRNDLKFKASLLLNSTPELRLIFFKMHQSLINQNYYGSYGGHPPNAPMSHVLRFWTMALHLSMDRTPYKSAVMSFTEKEQFMVRRESGEEISTIYLEPEWRRSQPDALEFFTLCSRVPLSAVPSRVILIERGKNNIAYRVQLLDWEEMRGQKSLGTHSPSKDEEIKLEIITLA